jgi:hypothetical protein
VKHSRQASTLDEVKAKWRQYMDHLRQAGFGPDDDLYRYFGGDVFHDSEVELTKVDVPGRTVVMAPRNVYAVNRVCEYLYKEGGPRARGGRAELERGDFLTRVVFKGVSRISLRATQRPGQPAYYVESVLDRAAGEIVLNTRLACGLGSGLLSIRFQAARIENIWPRLRKKYRLPDRKARSFLTWVGGTWLSED